MPQLSLGYFGLPKPWGNDLGGRMRGTRVAMGGATAADSSRSYLIR
jgi:hypothetical protein